MATSAQNTRLRAGNYIADVLIGNGQNLTSYYYIIQREGSAEVVDLAYFPSFELAKQKAEVALKEFAQSEDGFAVGESAAG